MNAFFLTLIVICWIVTKGDSLPYTNIFSKYDNQDDYYEDYYLRKIPKLKTTPDKIKKFLVNHLSWFPVDELEKERKSVNKKRSYFVNLQLEEDSASTLKPVNFSEEIFNKFEKLKNFSRLCLPSWSNLKTETFRSFQKVQDYVQKKHIKEIFKNFTHPFRYRGTNPSRSYVNNCGCYKFLGPSVRIHPKSSHVEIIKTSTTMFPIQNMHIPIPRKIKVVINMKESDRTLKKERNVKDKYYAGVESDNSNTTNVLETAGEMASDLAGKVTSLWHCVVGCHRPPDTKDVKFYLYTRRNVIMPELLNVNYGLINRKIRANPKQVDIDCVDLPPENIPDFVRVSDANREIIRSNYLNLKAPTKILIHGYTGSYKDSRMAKIKDAYLSSGRYNVIQVDWEVLAAPPCYIRVTHHSKFVGEIIAKFLDGLYLVGLNMSLVHIIGFSLGAQVAGFTGNNSTITPICRITGLDPALPLFLHTEPSGHLDKQDAKFVDVIHTCGGILAMLDPLGHVDFYPNGGTKQPGCEFSNLKCSHSRAPQYFAESVISDKKFTGQLCRNWEEYVAGNCNNATEISFMGEPCSRRSVSGKYYLLTKSKEPFAL